MDRNTDNIGFNPAFFSRSLRGNVDRNDVVLETSSEKYSRSLRGNVDRNDYYTLLEREEQVVPYVGTWIEIMQWPQPQLP